MSVDGERAPWLERLEDKTLGMEPLTPEATDAWRRIALERKQRLQELLHRELIYSGIISEEMSYSAVPLAIFGLEN